MHSGGISWSDLNPFNYEACIGDYCTDLDTIGEAAKETAVTMGREITDGSKTVYDFYAEKPAMLPAIVLGWPLMLFGAGCATAKKNEKPAPSVTLNFKESDSPLAYKLYQGLLREGVALSNIDKGYSIINFDRKYCPTHEEKSCTKGASDLKIEPQEVFEYALNNYQRFQRLIETTLGRPLPWVLDDLNPETTFDEKIRTKVTNAIDALKTILAKQGLSEESETYKERMAVGLLWFAALPQSQISTDAIIYPFMKDRLEMVGLSDFVDYLAQNGGLRVKSFKIDESTSLEALDKGYGDCSEFSKILFAIFRTAQLNPSFTIVQIGSSDIDSFVGPAEFKDQLSKFIQNFHTVDFYSNHVCICLKINGRLRLFDSMHFQDDARYARYTLATPRQFLSYIYSNSSQLLGTEKFEEIKSYFLQAITLDPMSVMAYYSYGLALYKKGSLAEAISIHTLGLNIYGSFPMLYLQRGAAWLKKGNSEKAIRDLTQFLRLAPDFPELAAGVINDVITAKWQNKTEETTTFSQDTSYDIVKVETLITKVIIMWKLEKKGEAKSQFDIVSRYFSLKRQPSAFTKQFFESMFQLMPADMQQDAEISGMITSIRRALGTAQ